VIASRPHPAYVVWELTLRCDHACTHCGSRAGHARSNELSTAEALGVVDQLAAAGAREVALIGGEAYLHDGFLEIVHALTARGIGPALVTGGRGITAELAAQLADARLTHASVSVDGLAATHDRMRSLRGSHASAMAALDHLRAAGVPTASNINVNRLNRDELEAVYDELRARGIRSWQVQLTSPLGRAADRPELLLQPYDLLDVVPRVAQLKLRARADGIVLTPGNNLGYFGPEETLLRSLAAGETDHWQGCQAGRFVLGIESDGAVKGCPSLQTTAYVRGNLRTQPLADILPALPPRRELWGFCATCAFADPCQGGCTFTAHAVFGRPGNNPYCHYRARTLAKQHLRERLVPAERPPGTPFDSGTFDLVLEPLDAPDPNAGLPPERLIQIRI
jgi:radical SAM protein with 4Fe4S-binding SPASM domain